MNPIFRAKDGKEFASAEEAERHHAVLAGFNAVEKAWKEAQKTRVTGFKTADGIEITLSVMDDYYLVHEERSIFGPHVERLSLYKVQDVHMDEYGRVKLHWTAWNGNKNESRNISIEELYAKERNAKLRVVEILKEQIRDNQIEILSREAELGVLGETELPRELEMAVQQLTGFHYAIYGGGTTPLINLLQGMNLKVTEWNAIREHVKFLNEEEKQEIEEYFAK